MKYLLVYHLLIAGNFFQSASCQSDYEIYSIIISEFKNQTLVIMNETSGFEKDIDPKRFMSTFKSLEKETIDDFATKLKASDTLRNTFVTNKKIVLLSSSRSNEIFGSPSQDGWEVFYEEYRGTQGITTFSRIGYNKNKTQAFVYCETQSHWLAGVGYYAIFEYKNGKWVHVGSREAWTS